MNAAPAVPQPGQPIAEGTPPSPQQTPTQAQATRVVADGKSTSTVDFWVGQLDLRPISLWRIFLGWFLVLDFVQLLPDVGAWYWDGGLWSRVVNLSDVRWNRFCLLDAFGSPTWTVYLYFLAAIFASACMAVGYKTRWAQIASFIFVWSLQERMNWPFDGSDNVLRFVTFWTLFCPTNHFYSVDAILAKRRGEALSPRGNAFPIRILQLQVCWIYLAGALIKLEGERWLDGTALHYVLHLPHTFGRSSGLLVADNPLLIKAGTWFTLALESSFTLLVLSPIFNRQTKSVALIAGTSLHAGIYAFTNVGNFCWLMPMTYLAFFEPEWTEAVVGRMAFFCQPGRPTRVYFDAKCAACRENADFWKAMDRFGFLEMLDLNSNPLPDLIASRLRPGTQHLHPYAVTIDGKCYTGLSTLSAIFARLPGTFLLAPLVNLPFVYQVWEFLYDWHSRRKHLRLLLAGGERMPVLPAVPIIFSEFTRKRTELVFYGLFILPLFVFSAWYSGPNSWRDAEQRWVPNIGITWMQTFGLWSKWDMFAPLPVHDDYVMRARAEFSDGTSEDLFGNQAGDDQPGWAHGFIYSRWTKIMEGLVGNSDNLKREWAMWECRSHNRGNPDRKLLRFTLAKWDQLIPPYDQPFPPSRVFTLWNHHCFDEEPKKKDNSNAKRITRLNSPGANRVTKVETRPEAEKAGAEKPEAAAPEQEKTEDDKAEAAKPEGVTGAPEKAEGTRSEEVKSGSSPAPVETPKTRP